MWNAPFTNGHNPAASPRGLILCGAGEITLVDFRVSPPKVWPLGPGYSPGWRRPTLGLFYRSIDGRHQQQVAVVPGIAGQAPHVEETDTPTHVAAGNTHAAAGGSWAACLTDAGNGLGQLVRGGQILATGLPMSGVAIVDDQTVTWMRVQKDPEVWAFCVFDSPSSSRLVSPTGAPHAFRGSIGAGRLLGYGYNGPARVLSLDDGSDRDVTVTPWGLESCPVIVLGPNGSRWVWTGTNHPTMGPIVLGRPYELSLEGTPCIYVPGIGSAGLDVVWHDEDDAWLIAGATPDGRLTITETSQLTPDIVLHPAMEKFPKPILFAPFFQFSDRPGYGNTPDYPANATILVEPSLYERVERAHPELGLIIDGGSVDSLRAAVKLRDRVIAIYLGDEVPAPEANELAGQCKRAWKQLGGRDIPLIWYVTPGMADRSDWTPPRNVDIFAPEYYFPRGTNYEGMRATLWRMTGRWLEKLGRAKPWAPAIQAFDRRRTATGDDLNTPAIMRDLARFQPEFLRMLVTRDERYGDPPPAIGVLPFSVNRPGGTRDYPQIREWHEAMRRSIPDGPIVMPTPTPNPGGPVAAPKFTIVEPRFPQEGIRIPEGGTLRCVYALESGSGRMDTIEWLLDGQAVATNPADDHDHTYRNVPPGEHRIGARGRGPGGVHETGAIRRLFVDRASTPTNPDPGHPTNPGQPPALRGMTLRSKKLGKFVVVNKSRPSPSSNGGWYLTATGDDVQQDVAQFTVFRGPGWTAFRAPVFDGITALVCTDIAIGDLGPVLANRPDTPPGEEGGWEQHEVQFFAGAKSYVIKAAANGKFWRVTDSGDLFADADNPEDEACQFTASVQLAPRGPVGHGLGGGAPIDVEAITRPLRKLGNKFFTDNGHDPYDYRETSAFALYRRFLDGEDIGPFFRYWKSKKANALRVFLTLGGNGWINRGSNIGPSYPQFWERLVEFTQLCAANGFYVRYVLVGGLEEFGVWPPNRGSHYTEECHRNVLAFTARVCSLLRNEPNVLYEPMNEFNQIGAGNAEGRELDEIAETVHAHAAPGTLCGLSNMNGPVADEPTFVRRPADYVDSHFDRRRGIGGFEWVKRTSETPIVDQDDMVAMSGEPINFGSAADNRPEGHDNERSPAVAYAYGATAKLKQYYPTFHYEGGLDARGVPDEATDACAEAWMRGLDDIPINPGGWCNGHHGCSPFEPDNFPPKDANEETWRGPIRIFGAQGGHGYIGVSIRERIDTPPRLKPGRSAREIGRVEYGEFCAVVRAEP